MKDPRDEHTCSYHCKRLKCIEAQRNELRDKMTKITSEAVEAEREDCAKIAEQGLIGHTIAKAIRARGKNEPR